MIARAEYPATHLDSMWTLSDVVRFVLHSESFCLWFAVWAIDEKVESSHRKSQNPPAILAYKLGNTSGTQSLDPRLRALKENIAIDREPDVVHMEHCIAED